MLSLAIAFGLLSSLLARAGAPSDPSLRLATFTCDVTPPIGHPLCGGWIKPLVAVDDPLLAKGVVLADGKGRYILCAVDWCLLQTESCDVLRRKLADAAGISESHVALHTVHQHNAPIADSAAERILSATPNPPLHLDLAFFDQVTDRLAASVRDACGRMQPFTHVSIGRAKVDRFASNRRVRLADGKVYSRTSATKQAALRDAPEGLIDPWLKTVTLVNDGRPLVRLHYYASHPMSYYGDGRANSDTVGLARLRIEREEGVFQVFFNGCAGNITAGKYNDGAPTNRAELSDRIYRAMKAAAASTVTTPVRDLDWRTARVRVFPCSEPGYSEAVSKAAVGNTNATTLERIKAALNLAWLERLKKSETIEISRLDLGGVLLLNLPGEAFIEYQLYAQTLRPNDFIAVAAYGECGPGYFCIDAAIADGGYEPTLSRVGPPSEIELKRGIARLLEPVRLPGPPVYPDKLHLLVWQDRKGVQHSIATPKEWEKRRAHILAGMQQAMGDLPPAPRKLSLGMQVMDEEVLPEFTRRQITFVSEVGDRVPAYLLIPRQASVRAKAPAMICLHQTTSIGKREPAGLGGNTNLHYAAELARRGYVTLAPDYPNFGDYRFDAYGAGYASATMKGIVNHRRAVDLLESLPEVDARRIGAIGHSLGGHNALFLAAFDPRIRAVITSCGFNSFFKYYGGKLTGWSHAGYMPRIASAYEQDPKQMPFDFTEVLTALAPRPVFINAPMKDVNFEVSGVKDCMVAAAPVYRLYGQEQSLTATHPNTGHDFPPDVRKAAYKWLDRYLKTP